MRALATMSKEELLALRAERVAELAAVSTVGRREEIQADLSNANARLKQINIEEAKQAKALADLKKSAGYAEERDNLRRAAAKASGNSPSPPPRRLPSQNQVAQPTSIQRSLTRGEFLLKNAKQMRKAIDSIKSDRRLPHTVEFLAQLDAFIVEQKQHLSELAETRTTSHASDWKRTWTDKTEESQE